MTQFVFPSSYMHMYFILIRAVEMLQKKTFFFFFLTAPTYMEIPGPGIESEVHLGLQVHPRP